MSITKSDVVKIAKLANLALTEDEKETFAVQLSSIVSYVEKLNELDTTDVPAMSHSTISGDTSYAMRDDRPHESLGAEVALSNAPDQKDGHFRVPKVIS